MQKHLGIKHTDVDTPDEFERLLKNAIESMKKLSDAVKEKVEKILPNEPIDVASMLINATYTREKGDIEKAFHKAFGNKSETVTENMYSVNDLKEIAEHLLAYCNNNGVISHDNTAADT